MRFGLHSKKNLASLTKMGVHRRHLLRQEDAEHQRACMWLCLILWTTISLAPFIAAGAVSFAPAPPPSYQSDGAGITTSGTPLKTELENARPLTNSVAHVSLRSTLLHEPTSSANAGSSSRARAMTLIARCQRGAMRTRQVITSANSRSPRNYMRSTVSTNSSVHCSMTTAEACAADTATLLTQELGWFMLGATSALIGSSASVVEAVYAGGELLCLRPLLEDVLWCMRRGGLHHFVGLLLLPASALSSTCIVMALLLRVASKVSLLCLVAGVISVVASWAEADMGLSADIASTGLCADAGLRVTAGLSFDAGMSAEGLSAALCWCYRIMLNYGILLLGARWFGFQGSFSPKK